MPGQVESDAPDILAVLGRGPVITSADIERAVQMQAPLHLGLVAAEVPKQFGGDLVGGPVIHRDTVRRLALELGMASETFRKKFARLAGQSPWRYRLERLIDQACWLVHEGQAGNKQIASQLGFSDEFHFSRRFKQITGLSPTQFRALLPRR